MLDANLPTFYRAATTTDTAKNQYTIYLTRADSDPTPAYTLRHADNSLPTSKNIYAAALFDPYNDDVLYGEVLLKPSWTQPTLSAEEIRRHGGIPPPPEPLLPTEFTIQLYNPEQQVVVTQRFASLTGTPRWDFSMPQSTFRTPSSSALDRTQNDPTADATIPRIKFCWKKETLSRDVTCYMTGKSTDMTKKKRGGAGASKKEPDITVALFRALKEVTVYEPNLQRCDMEDAKGLEVVLLLGAAVIRDVFCAAGSVKQAFNVPDLVRSTSAGNGVGVNIGAGASGRVPPSSSVETTPALPARSRVGGAESGTPTASGATHAPPTHLPSTHTATRPPPPPDPLAQWAIDAETARLKAAAEAEAREFRRREEARRRERERKNAEEARGVAQMLEAEERERARRRAEVERETERLRGIYGGHQQQQQPAAQDAFLLARPVPAPLSPTYANSGHARQQQPAGYSTAPHFPGPPLQAQGHGQTARPWGDSLPSLGSSSKGKPKKSFWNLRGLAQDDGASADARRGGSRIRGAAAVGDVLR